MNDGVGFGFYVELMREFVNDSLNSFAEENWDHERFGNFSINQKRRLISYMSKPLAKKSLVLIEDDRSSMLRAIDNIEARLPGLASLFDLLADDYSKSLMIKLVAYRMFGFRRVMLPTNNEHYRISSKQIRGLVGSDEVITTDFQDWKLNDYTLDPLGCPIRLFYTDDGVHRTFVMRQYEYSRGTLDIMANLGDYVIDAGACWGDTALYFSNKVGSKGMVYAFEFLPQNLKILEINLDRNKDLSQRIEVIPRALWSHTDMELPYKKNGPGTKLIKDANLSELGENARTLTVDDFVRDQRVTRVDFIKMDIEGSELQALIGSRETIAKYKPKLAIAIYHSLDDMVRIPEFLSSLGADYRFYLDHFSIHNEETILFAVSTLET